VPGIQICGKVLAKAKLIGVYITDRLETRDIHSVVHDKLLLLARVPQHGSAVNVNCQGQDLVVITPQSTVDTEKEKGCVVTGLDASHGNIRMP